MKTDGLNGLLYDSPNSVLQDVLQSEDGVPEWLQLTPSRGKFEGRDGRRFNIKSPRAVVKAFNDSGEDIQLDVDHASEMPAFMGGGTASVGWITEMQTRNGGQIWAKVEWTPDGDSLVRNRTFRGLSPVFRVDRESVEAFLENPQKNAMDVESILSVALTNRPNLKLKSLNSEGGQPIKPTEHSMDLTKLITALGLNAEATEADVFGAIAALKDQPAPEANAKSVDLSQYVPRADFDQLNSKYAGLEAARKEDIAKAFNAKVDSAITEALKAGKISPASEGYHRSACSDEKGLEAFQTYVKDAAPVVAPNSAEIKDSGEDKTVSMNLEAIAARSGLGVEDIKAQAEKLKAAGEIE